MTKKYINIELLLLSSILSLLVGCIEPAGQASDNNIPNPVEQTAISRVELMPNMPQPYRIINWQEKAAALDSYLFDFNSQLPGGTLIWIDNNQRNIPQFTFGLYTAVKDARQGADKNNGEFHESINSLSAILGAGLIGIDKTNQDGYNYVKMVQNYFNSDNNWNIVMNNTNPDVSGLGGGYSRDWWYDLLPNVLYYNICDIFPNVEYSDNIQRSIAEQIYRADLILDGNYNYSYFDYARMKGFVSHIPLQQDAAGGHGYLLYAAYMRYGEPAYLERAKTAIEALNSQPSSCFYEILLPIGIYTAARLNAEEGSSFNIAKMLDWVFNGNKNPKGRYGWGVIADKWGSYDVSGLQGSITDGAGYAFFMNSILMVMPLLPMVKYEPTFARAIGKWMLNNINACRLFYPDEIPDSNQWLPGMQDFTNSIIGYEGLRYQDDYGKEELKGVHPVAIGDGPKWHADNPDVTMFSVYSTAPVGILAAATETTDIEGIVKFNCNATDFYSYPSYPVYLLYNPYSYDCNITYNLSATSHTATPISSGTKTAHSHDGKTIATDLYDMISGQYLAKGVSSSAIITLPADQASLIVELPTGSRTDSKPIYKKQTE